MLADRLLDVLLEKLSPDEAERTFAIHGVPNALAMDKEDLKKAWRKLAVAHHPDRGGSTTTMRDINAAYDVLKLSGPSSRSSRSNYQPRPEPRPQPRPQGRRVWSDEDEENRPFSEGPWQDYPNVPLWAWAGYSGGSPPSYHIYRENYHDINFIKKTIWQMAGGRHPSGHLECTFWNYDGHYLRGVFTAYAGSQQEVLWEAAKAMREWDRRESEAVLMTLKGHPHAVYVIWYRPVGNIDGRRIANGMSHNSFNSNPGNDPEFMANLPAALRHQFGGYRA